MYKLTSISDEELISHSSGEVVNGNDYNFKPKVPRPVKGGLFDPTIFGMVERCWCGRTTKYGKVCPFCASLVVSREQADKRIGHIQLWNPIIPLVKIGRFTELMTALHPIFAVYLRNAETGYRESHTWKRLLTIYSYKLVYTEVPNIEEDESFYVTKDERNYRVTLVKYTEEDIVENASQYGPSGLKEFMKYEVHPIHNGKNNHFIKDYLNQVIMVLPITKRPINIALRNGSWKAQISSINSTYSAILIIDDLVSNHKETTLADTLTLLYGINNLVNLLMTDNELIRTSKESMVRNIQSQYVKRSGRSNITGDPTLPIDTIKLPRSLAYEALKVEIITDIRKRGIHNFLDEYQNPSPETIHAFEDMCSKACILFLRNPTLHKYNLTAFKIELWDEISIGMPILVTRLFNADFDGDQMAFFIILDPVQVEQTLRRQGVASNWYFEKSGLVSTGDHKDVVNKESIYAPTVSVLNGLYVATLCKHYGEGEEKEFDSISELKKAYDEFKIQSDEYCKVGKERTTYGRVRVEEILKFNLDEVIGERKPITAANIHRIMSAMNSKSEFIKSYNKIQVLKDLTDFALQLVTMHGSTTVSLEDIFQVTTDTEEFRAILNSKMDDRLKTKKLQEILPGLIDSQIRTLVNTSGKNSLHEILEGSGKVKKDQLSQLMGPRIEYTKDKGLVVHEGSLATGMDEEGYMSHSTENREVLKIKKSQISDAGYLGRQLIDIAYDVTFTKEDSISKRGAMLKKKDAIGRITIDGEAIAPNDSEEKVLVLSCIDGFPDKVSQMELSMVDPSFKNFEEGHPIGISFSSSVVGQLVQNALSLKHGGNVVYLSNTHLLSRTGGKVTTIGDNFIIVTDGDKNYKYPKPANLILTEATDGRTFEPHTILGYEDREMKQQEKLSNIFILLHSYSKIKGLRADDTRSKDFCFCYAPASGTISYDYDKHVTIGGVTIPYKKTAIYIYPEGTHINKGDRICSGTILLSQYHEAVEKDLAWTYYVFHDQLEEIQKDKSTKSEFYEVLFKTIASDNFSIKDTHHNLGKFLNELHHGEAKASVMKYIDKDIGTGLLTSLLLGSD